MENNDVLRSRHQALQDLIQQETENIGLFDKFTLILEEMNKLYESATTLKKEVRDAQILLDFVNKLLSSIKSFTKNEISPAGFITRLIQKYGEPDGLELSRSFKWKDLGEDVSGLFHDVSKCCSTMVGPMDFEVRKKKFVLKRKRSLMDVEHPVDLNNAAPIEERNSTERNMSTMFEILKTRKNFSDKVENVILNRNLFAQTAENLFALSFLVKEGKAEIKVDEDGHHVVKLRNAPRLDALDSGEVQCKHFVYRFDYNDWITMKDFVTAGDEVMPHRN